jgi:uncharacterized repeat protein (TIGR01451 family)
LSLTLLVVAQDPPVSVEKTAEPDQIFPDNPVHYRAVFSNSSDADVDLVLISDTLPVGFTYMGTAYGSDITDDPTGTTGTIVWDKGPYTVPANDTLTLAYDVWTSAPPSTQPYENRLEALLSTDQVIESVAPVTVLGVEIAASKGASESEIKANSTVVYSVRLENTGNADGVVTPMTDTLPVSFEFDRMVAGPLSEPTIQGNRLVWTEPLSVPMGDYVEFSYRVVVRGDVGQTYYNSVVAAYNGAVTDPADAGVKVLEGDYSSFLPVILKPAAPTPPDTANRLAYDAQPASNLEIMTIEADGTNPVNVSNRTGGDTAPTWSPDGTQLAWVHFEGNADIVAANIDGSNFRFLTTLSTGERAPDWSPDGTKIAFHSNREESRWEVYTMNVDGTNVTRLTDRECQSHDPLWSPDGTKIAFICGVDEYQDIFVMNADGSNLVRITHNEVPDNAPDWSPDSTKLAYVHYYSNRNDADSDIFVANAITGQRTQITNNDYADYGPVWSPDGTLIAFSTYMDGSYEIATMNPDGSNIKNLTNSVAGTRDNLPRWSSDGTKISFITERDGDPGSKELWVMDADGNNQMELADDIYADGNFVPTQRWNPHPPVP